nr:translocation/assembly module TamB domain-containing protein [Endozoicomonas sp. OPT23]
MPLLYGKVILTDGELSLSDEFPAISKLETELLANGQSGTLQGSLTINKGRLNLGGKLSWHNGFPFQGAFNIHGQNVIVPYPGYGTITISPDIVIKLATQPEITGNIDIPSAHILIKKLPDNAVKVSDDTIVIYPDKIQSGQQKESLYSLAVHIRLGEDVNLDAYGLTTKLAGELAVEKSPTKDFEGKGTVYLKDGRYHQFGQDLIIKKGKVTFQGALQSPYLQVDAVRNPDTIEDNVTVGVNVSGVVTKPEWTIYSSPSMTRQEQLSYLLKGTSVSNPGEASIESLAISAGIGQLGGFANNLGDKLGIDDLALEAEGTGDDTQIVIGGYFAPGLKLQYGAGVFNSIGELKARYELMPKLYLQVITGLDQAVDVFYRFAIPSE